MSRNRKGFTLAETLVAVGIIAILSGFAFVGLTGHARNLHQLEMDGIAKEIYVAAQNHLTMADSQGLLAGCGNKGIPEDPSAADNSVFYYVVGDGEGAVEPGDSTSVVLDLMLPYASIDETVRSGGNYIIRYEIPPENRIPSGARVLDVFYATRSGSYRYSFDQDDYTEILNVRDRVEKDADGNEYQVDKKSARRDYLSGGGVIGWYGESSPDALAMGAKLGDPTIEVVNGDRLVVNVKNPNTGNANANLKLVITGETSGAKYTFVLINKGTVVDTNRNVTNDGDGQFSVLLDDVTAPKTKAAGAAEWTITEGVSNHFRDIMSGIGLTLSEDGKAMIPGENITIQAISDNTEELTNVGYSSGVKTNSLFADMTYGGTPEAISSADAKIANFRHLENMDPAISGFENPYGVGKVFKASQAADMDWQSYKANIAKAYATGEDNQVDPNYTVQILHNDPEHEGSYLAEQPGYYMPVNMQKDSIYTGSYDTKTYAIQNVSVNYDGAAGIFGTLENCTLQNVRVYNTLSDDSALEITGTGSTGGLVGVMKGGMIQDCCASVYVKSTQGDAGGLVGKTEPIPPAGDVEEKTTEIKESYSGGHTVDGAYLAETAGAGRYNVQAKGSAGGLVGTVGKTTITDSYTTCSVYATEAEDTSVAGGFAGTADGGSIKGSYCTGLVGAALKAPGEDGKQETLAETKRAGAFIGSASDIVLGDGTSGVDAAATEMKQNHFFEAVTQDLPPMGKAPETLDITRVTSIDKDIATYSYFYAPISVDGEGKKVGPLRAARTYDATLTDYYFEKVTEEGVEKIMPLYPLYNPTGIGTHYGDWPAPETFIINE